MAAFLTHFLYSQKQKNIMKVNLNSTQSTPPTEQVLSIRNVLKLMGMKEVATNVFSLPAKNK
jgi:phenylalanyl-tRNA synthetase beta subunit